MGCGRSSYYNSLELKEDAVISDSPGPIRGDLYIKDDGRYKALVTSLAEDSVHFLMMDGDNLSGSGRWPLDDFQAQFILYRKALS